MTTRAMRRFTDEPVADADIERCLAAAVQAPSGGNIQPYQFLVVTDPDRKAALGELYRHGVRPLRPGGAAAGPAVRRRRGPSPPRAQLGHVEAAGRDDRHAPR